MKKLVILIFLFSANTSVFSQIEINGGPINVPSEGIIDGIYVKEIIPTKKMIAYDYVREADVVWNKKVWSFIDLREKINHPMYFPFDSYQKSPDGKDELWVINSSRWSLWTIMKHHIMTGDLTVFSVSNPYDITKQGVLDGDQFKYPIRAQNGLDYYSDSIFRSSVDERLSMITGGGLRPVLNIDGEDSTFVNALGEEEGITETYVIKEWILSEDIVQYRLKEEWFFDKQRSVMDVRILGIAPVIYEATKEGGKYEELFWLYFPHLRYTLNNYFVYNDANDAQWMSFDDLFWKRKFSSTVYKESNAFDRKIESYRTGVEALLEAEKIKEEIRTIEHDVWSF
jgi:gliding motility associated protien GldN